MDTSKPKIFNPPLPPFFSLTSIIYFIYYLWWRATATFNSEFPIPILVGILPLASDRHASSLQQEVPGIFIPEPIHQHMRSAGEKGAQEGIRFAIELINELKERVGGIYLMPAFNRFDYAAEIIEEVSEQ